MGVVGFLVGAIQVYSRKLRKRGAAVGGVYRFLWHPQYASLILAGTGMLLLRSRFLMVVLFVTMLFAYHVLAGIEERGCLRQYGHEYADYQRRTPRFLPVRLPFRGSVVGRLSARRWPIRLAVGLVAYGTTLTLATGLGFAVRTYTLDHLYTNPAGNAIYVSLTRLDQTALQRIAAVAAADARVQARLDASGDGARHINYVMPLGMGHHGHPHERRPNTSRSRRLRPPQTQDRLHQSPVLQGHRGARSRHPAPGHSHRAGEPQPGSTSRTWSHACWGHRTRSSTVACQFPPSEPRQVAPAQVVAVTCHVSNGLVPPGASRDGPGI